MSSEAQSASARILVALVSFALASSLVGQTPDRPELPPNYEKMSPEEQKKAKEDIRRQQLESQRGGDRKAAPQRGDPQDEKARMREGVQNLTVERPADPAEVKATFILAGESRTITAGERFEAFELMSKFEERAGQPLTDDRIYSHLLALAEARALGFDSTAEELTLSDPLFKNPVLMASMKERWEKQGITEDMYRRYETEKRIVQKLKDFYMNTTRTTSSEVFELYKRDHFVYRLQYVAWSASEIAEELRKNPIPDADLRRFWSDDKAARNQFRTPTTVNAEFVYFDQTMQAGDGTAGGAIEISYDESLSYYKRNKDRLDELIPADRRPELNPQGKVDIDKIVTPFDLLRPQIEREIRASGRVRVAFNEAKADPKTNLKALAEKYKLGYAPFVKAERQAFVNDPRFGMQIFGTLFNADTGKLSTDLSTERSTQFFWRQNAKEASREPDFEEVKDKLPILFFENTAYQRANDGAKAARAAIDAAVEAELKQEQEKKNADALTAAETEIRMRNVSDAAKQGEVRQRHLLIAGQQLQRSRGAAAGRVFEAVGKEQAWKIQDTGPFELAVSKFDRSNMAPKLAQENFLKSQGMIRNLEPGSVSQVVTDPGTKTHFIYRIAERAEPDFARISESDFLQMRALAERNKGYQIMMKCEFHEISRRLQFQQR